MSTNNLVTGSAGFNSAFGGSIAIGVTVVLGCRIDSNMDLIRMAKSCSDMGF